MTKYEELSSASIKSDQDWSAFQTRCLGYLLAFLDGFEAYCQIPADQLSVLFTHEKVGEALFGKSHISTAAKFADGYWCLTVCVQLPKQWVSFVLCVAEIDLAPVMRIGQQGEPILVNFSDATQCEAVYEAVFARAKRGFSQSFAPPAKSIWL